MRAKTKFLIVVALFMILEFLPFPVLAFVLLHVTLSRPAWFKHWVDQLYSEA